MAQVPFLRVADLERLRLNVSPNAKKYQADEPWLAGYLGEHWEVSSSITIPDDLELVPPDGKSDLRDLENTKRLYAALRTLTPLQASDERLWACLAHSTFWHYMRKRWPAEQYQDRRLVENIQERYFFSASDRSRALVRNGIARLWWYGYTSYDERRDDPFELTAVLLKNLDVTQSILERTFSRNRALTHAVLAALLERERAGAPFYERNRVRELAKYLVQLGGVTIIDALPSAEMLGVVRTKIDAMAPVAA